MRLGAVLLAALAATASAPLAAAPADEPLALRLSQVASGFCVDILSGKVALPDNPTQEAKLFQRYGLQQGVPPAGPAALGRDVSLIAQAVLASGTALDGAFMVAVGGRAGQTCRLIIYKALDGEFVQATYSAMQSVDANWWAAPEPRQSPAAKRLSLLKRDAQRRPFIANIIAPTTPGPIAAVVNVAAIPPNVTLPEGF